MKKQLPIIITACVFAITLGWWLRTRMSVPFTGFDGFYSCGDFGIPEKNYNVMRFQMIGDKMIMDSLFKSQSSPVGRLELHSSSLARLDMATELTHNPNLTLNPLAEHFIEGKRDTIQIVGRQEGKDLYRYKCTKTAQPY